MSKAKMLGTAAALLTGALLAGAGPELEVKLEPGRKIDTGKPVKIVLAVRGANRTNAAECRIVKPAKTENAFAASGATGDYAVREIKTSLPPSDQSLTLWIRGYGGGGELHGFKDGKQTLRKWVNFNSPNRWGWTKAGTFAAGSYGELKVVVPQTHRDGKLQGAIDYVVLSADPDATPGSCAAFHPGGDIGLSQEQQLQCAFSCAGINRPPYLWIKAPITAGGEDHMNNPGATDGYCSRQLAVRLPATGPELSLWVRGYGGGGELHGFKNGKQTLRKWVNFNSAGRWSWIALGKFATGTYDRLFFIVPKCFEQEKFVGGIDALALSTVAEFNPAALGLNGPSSIFFWTPGAAATGIQRFQAEASGPGWKITKEFEIEVKPAATPSDKTTAARNNEKLDFITFGDRANLSSAPNSDLLRVLGKAAAGENPLPPALNPTAGPQPAFIGVWAPVNGEELKRRDVDVAQADHNVTTPAKLPAAVTIPVNRRCNGLAFFHTVKGAGELDETLFEYTIGYVDGKNETVRIKEGERIGGQLKPVEITRGTRIYTSVVDNRSVNLYRTDWTNPRPDMTIATLTVRAVKSKIIPVVLGVAGVTGDGRTVTSGLPPPPTPATTVTINFLNSAGPVRNGLFAVNTPYLLQNESKRYFQLYREIGFSEARVWNRLHPTSEEGLPQRDGLEKATQAARRLVDGTKSTLMFNLFADLPGWILTDPKPERHLEKWTAWYATVVEFWLRERHLPVTSVELYNEKMIGHPEAENRLRYLYFNALADELKRRFPELKIGGSAECWPDYRVLEQFVIACGDRLDLLTWHLYATGKDTTPMKVLLARTDHFAKVSVQLDAMLRRLQPGRHIGQAITEYNLNYAAWKPVDLRLTRGEGTVWLASVLRHLLYTGWVDVALFWHYWGGGAYGAVDGKGMLRPNGMLFYLLNHELSGAKLASAASNDSRVEALAAERDDRYVIALINKADEPVEIELELLNPPGAVTTGEFELPVRSYRIGTGESAFVQQRAAVRPAGKSRIRLEKCSLLFNVTPKNGVTGH